MAKPTNKPAYGADEGRVYNTIFVLVGIPVALLVMFAPIHLLPNGAFDLPFVVTLAFGVAHLYVIFAITVVVSGYIAQKAVQIRRKRLAPPTIDGAPDE